MMKMGDAPAAGFDTAALAPHLPYLRRHARALAGSQQRGDHYVRASLAAVLAAPELLQPAAAPRLTLFRLFHRFWDPVNAAAGNADGLAPCGREALLLTAVENFSTAEAALILGQDEAAVAAAIVAARDDIARTIRSRVLIIEDEPVIAMHLTQIVEAMGHDVVATAATRTDAIAEAARAQPDLVLADIQLADGSSGIDAVADILASLTVPVVFITAYPERLLTGEGAEPTFLVTKPFDAENVVGTVGHALLAARGLHAPA
jgi:CheY-like chemotaxis protein/DNA-directed RNA polymerase specialized sigma24 family protein